jgi:hypothetical protein
MVSGLWYVGLWYEGGFAPYLHGQFRSIFSVKLFVELSRPRPDFINILAPTDASSADLDWIKAELSQARPGRGALSFTAVFAGADAWPNEALEPQPTAGFSLRQGEARSLRQT